MKYKNSLQLPERNQKPRISGMNMILEKGIDSNSFRSYLSDYHHLIDYLKFTSGMGLVDTQINHKIESCYNHNIIPYLGGTLFEKFLYHNKINEFVELNRTLGLSTIEISNGVLDLKFNEICDHIKRFKDQNFKVLVEIGSKDTEYVMPPSIWIEQINRAIQDGADLLILEGRESGTAGLYRGSGEIRTGLLEEIANQIDLDRLIFEAPNKKSQCYLINKFGANVNLGNLKIEDLNIVEVQRLGLRFDTFFINS